jgi:hypothetical protein
MVCVVTVTMVEMLVRVLVKVNDPKVNVVVELKVGTFTKAVRVVAKKRVVVKVVVS